MNKIVLLVPIFVVACATKPAFQKASDGTNGYVAKDLESKTHFQVTVHLPTGNDPKFVQAYSLRAVGEECSIRGFQYFDFAWHADDKIEGFCFTDSTRKALAISFRADGLAQSPAKFVVQDLNSKTSTQLEPGDEILTVDSVPLTSMVQVKGLVFQAAAQRRSHLPIKLKRAEKEITVSEPLADLKGGSMGPSDLDASRRLVR